jgi:hypothetical protein
MPVMECHSYHHWHRGPHSVPFQSIFSHPVSMRYNFISFRLCTHLPSGSFTRSFQVKICYAFIISLMLVTSYFLLQFPKHLLHENGSTLWKLLTFQDKRRSSSCVFTFNNPRPRLHVPMCECWGFPWAGELYVGWFEETVTLCHSSAGLQSTRYVAEFLLLYSVAKSKIPQTFYTCVHTFTAGGFALI